MPEDALGGRRLLGRELLALRTVASGAGRLGSPAAGLGAGRLFVRSAAAPARCRPWDGGLAPPGACGPAEGGASVAGAEETILYYIKW
jgi:hypothetical protein